MPMTSVRMPEQLMNKLEAIAEKLDRSKGWIIKDAISQYVERIDQREKMLADTRQALVDLEDGNVLNGEEVMSWIESWGKADEKSPPTI
ncbi:MAG: transcriptional regulator [Gammaproteobacteria bacterium CG22_combo_CG10-13_8_21_14_all_40_8]|nr:MAG: transcriptional regulator [Gammaproteobacteria bacterium CG22_combo_CG10-13_8_21_14_all_40_8]